ncbi:hypothetical protein LTR56_016003 [Elasticomyces elasticus]|nr:hypothetical protein LTR22_025196 [Elasticomyces elasticus]KAK3633089.1 hypothetical protein LTR56_016003 [Elasticomyces elasticus]KAK4917919.1 hypothetical protein LTR49_014194 [Elasticomyces elasticus]KAK5753315.1 hypothetical protein LTS12_016558 [Elasticomyces elasticus]
MFKNVRSPTQTPTPKRRVVKTPYYEDIYGTENLDEDQNADACESDSDSDNDMAERDPANGRTDRIFKPYVRSPKQHISDESEHDGETSSDETVSLNAEGALAEGDIFSNHNLPYNNNNISKPTATSRPNLFRRRRTPTQTTPTKNKYGMFGAAPLTPETSSNMNSINTSDAIAFNGFGERDITLQASTTSINQHPNNVLATDTMDDAFATFEPADDLLGGFENALTEPTQQSNSHESMLDLGTNLSAFTHQNGNDALEDQAATVLQSDPNFVLYQPALAQQAGDDAPSEQATSEFQIQASSAPMDTTDTSRAQSADPNSAVARDSPMPGSFPEEAEAVEEQNDMEEDGGYQADVDNTIDQIEAPQPKRRGRPPKGASPSKESAPATTTLDTPRSTRSATTKQVEAEKAEKIANRLRKRQSLPAPSRASPRNKETARSATLRKKGKQAAPVANGINKKTVTKGSRKSGRLEGIRNWKGEKLGEGKAYVQVHEAVEDREEYEKHY